MLNQIYQQVRYHFLGSFASQGAGSDLLGGWQHSFSSTLDAKGVSYKNWKGLKTETFKGASEACTTGWDSIKSTAYNGKLEDAQAIFHQGLCDLYLDSEIVASLPVRSQGEKADFPLHSLTRPDGTSYTFFQKDKAWVTTTATPLQ